SELARVGGAIYLPLPRCCRASKILSLRTPGNVCQLLRPTRGGARFFQSHHLATLVSFHRAGDAFGRLVRSGEQGRVRPADVMPRRHAAPRMAEQFSYRRVAVAFVRREARE